MDFNSYLLKKIALNGSQTGSFGSLTMNNIEQLQNVSLFSSASLEQLQELDLEGLLQAENATDVLPEDATTDQKALNEIVKALMGLEEVQGAADIDGDGEISETEAMEFLKSIMGNDGDIENLTYDDINKAVEQLGINLEELADKAIEEALAEEFQEVEEAKETEKTQPTQQTSNTGNCSGGGCTNRTNSSNNTTTTQKTAAEELEELEKQKQEIIKEADSNIAAKEQEKDNLINDNDKISKELKDEYNDAKNSLNETKETIKTEQSNLDGYKSDLSGVEQNISALEGEKSTISTTTDDEEINKQNKARLSEIDSALKAKQKEKEELQEKIEKSEGNIEKLEEKQKTQEEALLAVEEKIAKADPELKVKLDKVNTEIFELKTQKATDVKDIDAKIQKKRTEANEEAKQAGKNKGNAANNIGSGLVELASKYMGLNESDGSYKLFTNGRTEAWCADFVSYIVKEYANQEGLTLKDGFGSPSVSNIMNWAKENGIYNDITSMSSSEKMDFLNNDLKPGDVIIWKRNGMSHTGIIKSINDDGTFETIEGNSSDQVKSNTYNIDNNKLSGFIKFSDIVS